MRLKIRSLIQNIVLLVLLIAVFGATFLILFDASFLGKIYPRVSAAGKNIGYFEPKSAQQSVENKIDLWKNQNIQISYSEPNNPNAPKKWRIRPDEMGITPSAAKTILKAYNAGRTANPLKALGEKIKIIARGENFPLYYDLDENKFNSFLATKFLLLEKPPKNASLAFADGKLMEISAENGYTIDRDNFKKEIIAAIETLAGEPVQIKMAVSAPEVTDEKIREAEMEGKSLLESKIALRFEDKIWKLNSDFVKSSLQFEFGARDETGGTPALLLKIKQDPIAGILEKIQLEINREARNAILGVKDDKIVIESGGETGIALSVESSAQKIAGEMESAAKNGNKNIEIGLVVKETDPVIGQKTLEEKNINALLGQGKSNFAGSPKNRRYNIGVGAAKFNNVFIAPDEEFSFVKTLGEITEKAGYLPELVIKEDKTVPELGGGLCQVSTTAFRAAIYAGLPILERRPHSYPVIYYNPQGMDATIYPPHPDLKFKNDTGGYILIQTKVVKNELFFNFFGTKQNRRIKIVGPNVYDKQPDGSMKAVFWREFYDGDTLLKKESFSSSYSSPAKFPHKNPLE